MSPPEEKPGSRLSIASKFTEPLPDTPVSARERSRPPPSSRSSRLDPSTASQPLTPSSSIPANRKDVGTGMGAATSPAASSADAVAMDSPPLPPTPQPKPEPKDRATALPDSSTGLKKRKASKAQIKAKSLDEASAEMAEAVDPGARRIVPTWRYTAARAGALYLVPALLSIPLSLILALARLLLQPIYNSTPLSLHPFALYSILAIIPTIIIWHTARYGRPSKALSGRVCLSVSALGGDLVAISGRRVGSLAGRLGGPEWGAFGAKAVLGLAVVGGGVGFAALCWDHVVTVKGGSAGRQRALSFADLLFRSAFYAGHIWLAERIWMRFLSGSTSMLVQSPEKSILFLTLLITLLSLLLRPTPSPTSFARNLHSAVSTRLALTPSSSGTLWTVLSRLPRQVFPILLLLRLPLVIIALRQQLFLRPSPPYLAASGGVRILSSERGLTGQIVIGEEVQRGFRFMRCDASILGGRWVRTTPGVRGGPPRVDLGDSIFATFPMQEIGLLAHRSDETESVARTVALSTGLQVAPEAELRDDAGKPADRALIIGLGVGIAAQAFSRQSLEIDMVEIDPLVYHAAVDHFGLTLPPSTTINLLDGNQYVSSLAKMRREGTYEGQKWRLVIQDCFSGGSVPEEMFTREFWGDLAENVEQDGVVAMNFVGVLKSQASRAVLVTLTSVFEQCRAFGDPAEAHVDEEQSINMVVFCTNALNPLLTFRKPTPADVLRSPLRSHVYSTSQANEIMLHDVITEADRVNPEFMLRRGEERMDKEGWQVASGLSMWYNMQKILTPEMWMAF